MCRSAAAKACSSRKVPVKVVDEGGELSAEERRELGAEVGKPQAAQNVLQGAVTHGRLAVTRQQVRVDHALDEWPASIGHVSVEAVQGRVDFGGEFG